MTKIKLCGLSGMEDIIVVNELQPEYVGFVFAKKSKRYVTPETAARLKNALSKEIQAVGVFVNEPVEQVAGLLNDGVIDVAQLHGTEEEDYIRELRGLTQKPIIKAFRIEKEEDLALLEGCSADYFLLDSGAGSGEIFDWKWIKSVQKPFFLAGGLNEQNVGDAVKQVSPFAVDVSSGIESNGKKDKDKMTAFVTAVRKRNERG